MTKGLERLSNQNLQVFTQCHKTIPNTTEDDQISELSLRSDQWQKFEVQKLLNQNALKWRLQKINISFMKQRDLFVSFKVLNHQCLTELSLKFCQIASIQNLQNIEFQSLQNLNLYGNYITSINAFRKTSAPILKSLNLTSNKINQLCITSECKFSNLQFIYLENSNVFIQGDSVDWLFKIQSNHATQIRLKSIKRVQNRLKIKEKMKRKFTNLMQLEQQ